MKKVIIYGNGRISKIVYQFIKKEYDVVAFTVDSKFIDDTEHDIEGIALIAFENIQNIYSSQEHFMIIAVGYVDMNDVRNLKYKEAKKKGYSFINYIHHSVEIHDNFQIGENNIILDHVTLQPYSTIGNSNIIWSNSVIAHGCDLGDANWITSGVVISGDSKVKSKCFLGANSTIGHNVVVDDETFVGANTLLTKNTDKKDVYISKDGEKYRLDSHRFLQFAGV